MHRHNKSKISMIGVLGKRNYRTPFDIEQNRKFNRDEVKEGFTKPSCYRTLAFDDPENPYSYSTCYGGMSYNAPKGCSSFEGYSVSRSSEAPLDDKKYEMYYKTRCNSC